MCAALATAMLGAESLVCLCIDSSRVSQSDQSLNDIAWCLFIIIPTSDLLIKQEKWKKKNPPTEAIPQGASEISIEAYPFLH